jgi:biopolymer transport protein ExbD
VVRFGKTSGDFQRVEMMMTPMIDVCFQMIIFFVANMRIFSPEGNFNIEMPSAPATTQVGAASDEKQLPAIRVRLRADKEGNLAGLQMGQRKLGTFQDLTREIKQITGADRGPAAASSGPEVEFECDYNLKYEYVIDAVTAVSGYVSHDDQTVVRMIEKIRFLSPPAKKEQK